VILDNLNLRWRTKTSVAAVSFKSVGRKITAILEAPNERNPPGVIYIHGFTSSGTKESTPDSTHKTVKTAAKLRQLGFLVLRFDFRGVGKSEGEFMEEGVAGEVRDLIAAVNLMRSRGCEEVSVLGSSLGEAVAILNYEYLKSRSLVLWNPVTNPKTFSLPYRGHSEKEVRDLIGSGGAIDFLDSGKKYKIGSSF